MITEKNQFSDGDYQQQKQADSFVSIVNGTIYSLSEAIETFSELTNYLNRNTAEYKLGMEMKKALDQYNKAGVNRTYS